MPGFLSLTIGTETITIPLKLTNAQLRAIVRRAAIRRGVPVEMLTPQEIGRAVLKHLAKTVRDDALDQHRQELLQEQQAAMEAILAADNDLYDEIETLPPLGQP